MSSFQRVSRLQGAALGALLIAIAPTGCTSGEGSFAINFTWQGGTPPTNLPSPLFMYATITAPGSSAAVATAGPNPYTPGGTLTFSTVPNGSGLVAQAELLNAPGTAAQIVAYGISAPFSLEPGKNVTVNVPLALHTVVALPPATDGAAVTVISAHDSGEVDSSTVSLSLLAGTGAVGARISNLPALPPGLGGTMDIATLSPNPAVTPPANYLSFRYDGWNLDSGLTACRPGTICQRQVYVYFTDANGIPSATASATVTVNRLTPSIVVDVNPSDAKVGEAIAIAATPTEPLAQTPVSHVYAAGDTHMTNELLGFLTPRMGSQYVFEHVVAASDTDGSYFATFDLVDEAGNVANAVGADGSISFTVESTTPVISNVQANAERFSAVSPYNHMILSFDSSESLDTAPAQVRVTVGQYPMICGSYQTSAPSYTCRYDVLGSELAADDETPISTLPEATLPVLISAVNGIGNHGSADTSVTFDFMPPKLVAATASVPTIGVGQTESLELTPSETLETSPAPTLAVSPDTLSFALLTGTAYVWQHAVLATDASGAYATTLAMTDLVGNTAMVTGPTFMVDTLIPVISNARTDAVAYSEVMGHDVVTLTFNVPKDVHSGLMVTLGAAPMVCGAYQAQAPNYTCTYKVTGRETSGAQSIIIEAVDEADNVASSLVTVTFDFTAPTLTANAAPNPANANAAPVLSIASSKPLLNPPQVIIAAGAGATGGVTASMPVSGGTSWTLMLQATGPALGSFNIAVTGTDDVGHPGTVSTTFAINTVPPAIRHVATNASRFSAVTGFNQVNVTFDSSENLDVAPASLRVTVGQSPMSCGTFQSTGPSYTCTYAVTGNELASDGLTLIKNLAEENLPITIEAVDSAGNEGSGSGSVTFDFMPPALAAPAIITYIPGAGNVLATVSRATVGTDVRATFTLSETLGGNPSVTSTPTGLGFTLTSASGVSYVFDASPSAVGSPSDGSYGLSITAKDVVGNMATLTPVAPVATVDTTAPASPATAAEGPVTYTRIPWGSAATHGIPTFTVTGMAGAVGDSGTVIVYDGANVENASELGRSTADDSGAFTVPLSRADHAQVFVSAVDAAGNVSTPAPVHDITWTATFGGKTPGDTLANPHVLEASQDFLVSGASSPFLGPLTQHPTFSAEAATYAGVASAGGQPLVTTAAQSAWGAVGPGSGPGVRISGVMTYDAARGVSVLFGGESDTGLPSETWEWDGSTWTQAVAAGVSPSGRARTAMAYDSARGVSVLFGGSDELGGVFGDTWEWDGVAWTNVVPAGTSPSARYWHSMAYDAARGVTVLFGGRDSADNHLGDIWEWDGATWTNPTPTGATPSARDAAGLAYDAESGVTVLFGGFTAATPVGDTWLWDGQTWSNPTPTTSPGTLWGHTLTYDSVQGRVVLTGGCTSTGGTCTSVTSAVWEWDGQTWALQTPAGGAAPVARYTAQAAFDSQHDVTVIYGGSDTHSDDLLPDTWLWSGMAWANASPSEMTPGDRIEDAMAYDSTRNVSVLFGGCTEFESFACAGLANDTWQWSGTAWTNVSPTATASPPERNGHAMAYDSHQQLTVLMGGGNFTAVFNDVWTWNGTVWTAVAPSSPAPAAREYHVMAFDSARENTVLFGGDDGNGVLFGDTWTWTASGWINKTPSSGGPSPRTSSALAYDASRGVSVLFGGCTVLDQNTGACTLVSNDTWEWNGSSWRNVTPAGTSPNARWDHLLAYDSARGVTVLFGGSGLTTADGDTWEWDGSAWANVVVNGSSPPARILGAMTYDSAREATVLFGGEDSTYNLLGDTWLQPSEAGRRAAEIAEFSFGAAEATTPAIQQLSFTTSIGGVGNTLASPGPGVSVNGATLAVWNGSAGAWTQLASNTTAVGGPTQLQYTTASPAEAAQYVFGAGETINLAMFSTAGRGNGLSPAQVAVGYSELTVQYQQ